ncbi:MAG: CoA transferase [Myxococcota bacterium]
MLSHLRVLDLTDGGTGLAGQILAQLGAEVILIEPPGGLASRRRGPFAEDLPDPERSLEFWAHHRGKRSLILDLGTEAGRMELLELARGADVWIADGSRGDLGPAFSPNALNDTAPGLVVCSISAYGSIGPKSDWPATDLTATASSVTHFMTGDADRAPIVPSVPQAFYHAAGDAASAIVIALEERRRSGRGQQLDVSAQVSYMQANQSGVLSFGWNATPLRRTGGGVMLGDYRVRFVYACADGYMNFTFLFGEPIGHATARFFAWMDEEGFATDAIRNEDWVRYAAKMMGGETTVEAHEAVLAAIERFTRSKTKAEILEAAFERNLLIVPMNDFRDLVDSVQLRAREFWVPIRQPGMDREVPHPGAFARLSATPLVTNTPAPRLGEMRPEERERAPSGPASLASTERANGERSRPLDGLKVLDFTWVYAGPAITRQLADFGATVIKVESPTAPDSLRAMQPWKDDTTGPNRSANFSSINLGKRSLGLDMKAPGARDLVLSLVDWADVVVENFSPRAMKGWDLDWSVLGARKPSLVMLSSSLMGHTGPHRMLAGYGTMGSSIAGFGFVTGWPGERPCAPYVAYTDYVSPRFAVPTLLAAVDHARRTGVGQHIDLSQAEASMHFLGAALLDYTANGRVLGARGNAHPHYGPSGVYPTAGEDQWIAIAAPDEDSFAALDRVASLGWSEDGRFATAEARLDHADELDTALASWTAGQKRDVLEAQLVAAGVPAHRVCESRDAFEDPQLEARGHFVPLAYGDCGPVPYENARVRFSATPAEPRPCPTLGQDNNRILSELLGLDDDAITELVIQGAIQ